MAVGSLTPRQTLTKIRHKCLKDREVNQKVFWCTYQTGAPKIKPSQLLLHNLPISQPAHPTEEEELEEVGEAKINESQVVLADDVMP